MEKLLEYEENDVTLRFPNKTPDIIVKEAVKHVPHDDDGYAYELVKHVRTDIYVYSMVICEDWLHYMVTFYNNQNYDDGVTITKTRIDF